MGRKPLSPDGLLTPAERTRRYRQKHRARINRTRRLRRMGVAQPHTGLSVRPTQLDGVGGRRKRLASHSRTGHLMRIVRQGIPGKMKSFLEHTEGVL
jgi:hypothetical protein